MIKTYKEYIEYHPFGKNQGGKINYIRKLMIDIDNDKYNLKEKDKEKILNQLYDIEDKILKEINNGLDQAIGIIAKIS